MSPRPIPVHDLVNRGKHGQPVMGGAYAGDPNTQKGEGANPDSLAVDNATGATTGHGSRLLSPMSDAAPVQQLTPDQRLFHDTLGAGKWQADFDTGANAPLNSVTRHPDGTCDTTALEADGNQWIDLGGHGARDVSVGRP